MEYVLANKTLRFTNYPAPEIHPTDTMATKCHPVLQQHRQWALVSSWEHKEGTENHLWRISAQEMVSFWRRNNWSRLAELSILKGKYISLPASAFPRPFSGLSSHQFTSHMQHNPSQGPCKMVSWALSATDSVSQLGAFPSSE